MLNIEIGGGCIVYYAFKFITVFLTDFPFVLSSYDLGMG